MSKRIDKSWLVFTSIENFEHDRCVDLFTRADGSYGFEEFRRDAEDRGAWTPVQYYSGAAYASAQDALAAAMQSVAWLADASPKAHRRKNCCGGMRSEPDPEKSLPPDLIRGWAPVFRKDHAPSKYI